MQIRLYKAFSSELMKIAGHLADADIRALLAERGGDDEYLEGGELPTGAVPMDKAAADYSRRYTPPSTYNVRGKKPTGRGSTYETASNIASSTLKGGMTGAGVYALHHNLRHGFGESAATMKPKHLGAAVVGGAGIALTDRILRHRAAKRAHETEKAAALVSPNPNAAFRSPGLALKATSQVGKKIGVHTPKVL